MQIRTRSFIVVLLITVVAAGVFAAIQFVPALTAENTTLLDEDALLNIAIETAQAYGLTSDPDILVSEYILAREWGPTMTTTRPQYEPELMIYVVSMAGTFDPFPMPGFSVPNPDGEDAVNPDPNAEEVAGPDGMTLGIDAFSGTIVHVHMVPYTDLSLMTTDADRAAYDMLSREDWSPIEQIVPFPSPEITEEPLQGLPKRPDSR